MASVECNPNATAAAGYQFDGWYNLSDEKVSDQATYTVEAQTSLTLVAKFQEETQHTHTVTLVKGTPATCTQPGVKDYYQCDCGAVFEDEAMTKPIEDLDTWKVIPALGHKTEVQGAKEATCTAEGYTGDQVCTVCGETVEKGQAIPMKDHHYENGVCVDCGAKDPNYVEPTPKPTTEPTPAPTQEPQESQKPETTDKPQATEDPGKVPPTGDASQLMLYVAALAGATLLLGTAAVARKRRG